MCRPQLSTHELVSPGPIAEHRERTVILYGRHGQTIVRCTRHRDTLGHCRSQSFSCLSYFLPDRSSLSRCSAAKHSSMALGTHIDRVSTRRSSLKAYSNGRSHRRRDGRSLLSRCEIPLAKRSCQHPREQKDCEDCTEARSGQQTFPLVHVRRASFESER